MTTTPNANDNAHFKKIDIKILINVQKYVRRFLATKRFFQLDFNETSVR